MTTLGQKLLDDIIGIHEDPLIEAYLWLQESYEALWAPVRSVLDSFWDIDGDIFINGLLEKLVLVLKDERHEQAKKVLKVLDDLANS